MSSNSFFFNNVDIDFLENDSVEQLKAYSLENSQHLYLINKPLSEKKYDYTVNKALIFLCPGYNIQFVNLQMDDEEFEDTYLDFIEDLGHIADKYNYTEIISRPRKWKPFIKQIHGKEFFESTTSKENFLDFLSANKIEDEKQKRTVKLLISLLTGSINSVQKVGKDIPQSILEKVKQNIILFDGDQTRFIFDENYQDKIIKIQGLAGTGKTELLLHRLKELYVDDNKDSRIVLTCQSKTLANKLKNRVTEFFNFMKVEEQIEWEERLWVMHAWGSDKNRTNIGTYGLLCKKYKLPFYTPGEGSFAHACKKTLDYVNNLNMEFEPLFDYMLIDEGQDFTEEFIKLCAKFTKYNVIVAGDIFQDIFGIQKIETESHYLLNKCYRTDPRTLMFSHALGMGLFEDNSLRFLKDHEWKACGYNFEKIEGNYILRREPVKRFEDLDPLVTQKSMFIKEYDDNETISVLEAIQSIKTDFSDVKPEDIAVVFTNPRLNYNKIDKLETAIYLNLQWNVNIIHNTKEITPGTLTISNKNNIKGLEFPFVITVVDYGINDNLPQRNTLYMTLTRSFISSYLVIKKDENLKLIDNLEKGLKEINESLGMTVPEPTEEERQKQEALIKEYNEITKNQYEIVTEIFEEFSVLKEDRPIFREAVQRFRPYETNKNKLKLFIRTLMGDAYEQRI